jgi:hypothetical protein
MDFFMAEKKYRYKIEQMSSYYYYYYHYQQSKINIKETSGGVD